MSNLPRLLALKSFPLFFLSLFIVSCSLDDSFQDIREKGVLTIITRNNNFCYYSYRDEKMGFEYDLMKEFADRNKLELNIIVMNDSKEMANSIKNGNADVIAANMTASAEYEESLSFTEPHLRDAQIIVINSKNTEVRNGSSLNGKTLTLSANYAYISKGIELTKRYPDLDISVDAQMDTEDILKGISEGEIYGTIANLMVFKLNKSFYPNIKEVFPVSKTEEIVWGVKRGNSELLAKLNSYLKEILKDGFYRKTYLRYFSALDAQNELNVSAFKELYQSNFNLYRNIVKAESERKSLDWRLVSALIFQESHFNPSAKSSRGAIGLMQLMPNTLKGLGVKDETNVQENIAAGVKYLDQLRKHFEDVPEDQKHYYLLASYNIGPGHILDAMKLAEELNLNKNAWMDMEKVLPLLMKEEYYSGTKYGYCRSIETLEFVRNVMMYFEVLKEKNLDLLEPQTSAKSDGA